MAWLFGIDTAAHEGVLKAKGKTIAVLGCGFDHIFPKENINLYNRIIDSGGTVISEYAPNVEARSELFVERNRIVSGLSMGTLVVEAKHRSGTSITAELAIKQGRKVFCLNQAVSDKYEVGTTRLLVQGKAMLVKTTKDIIKHYPFLTYIEPPSKMYKQIEFDDIFQEQIYNELKRRNMDSNELSKKLKWSIGEINATLSIMEMGELIVKEPNGKFKIKED